MKNIKFNYLYRDAGNYKKWGSVIFCNPEGLPVDSITQMLKNAFSEECLFIGSQIQVPDLFPFEKGDPTADDHCFHEFYSLEETAESENDVLSRSIGQFAASAKSEGASGWKAFDPAALNSREPDTDR